MGLVETEAIVLRTYKLAEADKIAICLTREAGVVRGVARGARRLKSRYGASLEPFTHIALSYFEKEGRDLVTLSRAEILHSHFGLARQPEVFAALEYMGELAIEFAPPHQQDEKLFRMVRACLSALTETEAADLSGVVRYYEMWMLKLAGFLPDLRVCINCRGELQRGQVYLSAEGALRCAVCTGGAGLKLSAHALTQLRAMRSESPSVWARRDATAPVEAREELARLAHRLIERALERKPRGRAALFAQMQTSQVD
jgi:DNA repair protein RecO (recombination protein O)